MNYLSLLSILVLGLLSQSNGSSIGSDAYVARLAAKYNQLDAAKLSSVDELAKIILQSPEKLEPDFERFKREAPGLLIRLADKARDPNVLRFAKMGSTFVPMPESTYRSLVQKHLFEPCEYYVNQLGPNIFSEWEREHPAGSEDVPHNFQVGLVKFGMCKAMIARNYALTQSIVGSVRAAPASYIIRE